MRHDCPHHKSPTFWNAICSWRLQRIVYWCLTLHIHTKSLVCLKSPSSCVRVSLRWTCSLASLMPCKEAEESHAAMPCFPSVLARLEIFSLGIEWSRIWSKWEENSSPVTFPNISSQKKIEILTKRYHFHLMLQGQQHKTWIYFVCWFAETRLYLKAIQNVLFTKLINEIKGADEN